MGLVVRTGVVLPRARHTPLGRDVRRPRCASGPHVEETVDVAPLGRVGGLRLLVAADADALHSAADITGLAIAADAIRHGLAVGARCVTPPNDNLGCHRGGACTPADDGVRAVPLPQPSGGRDSYRSPMLVVLAHPYM